MPDVPAQRGLTEAAWGHCTAGVAASCGFSLGNPAAVEDGEAQAYFDGTSTGELLTRLTVDVSRLSTAVADNLGQRGVRSLFEVSNAASAYIRRQCCVRG